MGQEIIEKLVIKYAADVKAALAGIASLKSAVSGVDSHVSSAASNIRGAVGKIAKGFALAGVAAGVGFAAAGGAAVNSAANMESYMATLTQLYGSQEAAGEKMQWLLNFAKNTPFEITGLVEATTKLKAYGIEGEEVLQTLGDTASAMGKPIDAAVEALADAQTGEFERLKEFGIKAVVVTKSNMDQFGATIDQVGQTALTSVDKNGKEMASIVDRNNREMVTSTLTSIWNEKYAGGMEKQSQTMKGMVSNIKDSMSQAGLAIMGFDTSIGDFKPDSLFSKVKTAVQKVPDYLDGLDYSQIAENIKNVIDGIIETVENLSPTFENLKSIASSAKDILTDLFNSITGDNADTKTFTDTINTLTGALAKVFKWIDEHPTITKLAATIVGAAIAFSYLLPIVSGIIGVFGILSGVAQTLFLWWATGGTVVELIGIAIGALGGPITVIIGVIALLAAAWATNMFGIRDKTKVAIEIIKTKWDEFKEALGLAWEFAKQTVDDLKIAMGDAVAAFDQLRQIPDILSRLKDSVSGQFRELIDGALEWGGNMIDSFVEGITSKIDAAKDAVSNVADTVKDFLGINSPAKKGPLSELMGWGPNLVTTFADGISSNMGMLDTVFAGIAPPTLPQIIPSINKDEIFSSLTDIESGILDTVSRSKELLDVGVQKLKEIIEGLTPTLENLKTGALALLTGGIYLLYVAWKDNLFGIQDKTKAAVEWIKEHFEDLQTGALALLTGGIYLLYVAWKDNLFGIQDRTHEVIEKVKGIFGTLGEYISNMKNDALEWGANLIDSFVDGLTARIEALKDTSSKVAEVIADYLGINSPAKKGPLSELMNWGPNLVHTFADGISSNMGMLDTVFAGMATPAFSSEGLSVGAGRGGSSGAPGQVQVNNYITIPGMVVREDADLDKLASRVEKVVGKAVQGVRL